MAKLPRTTPKPFTPEAGRYCYYIPADAYVEGHGYRVSVVFENISGHIPTGTWPYEGKPGQVLPYFWGDDYKTAKEQAKRQNERLGLSSREAHEIVAHSMRPALERAQRTGRP